MKLNWFSIKSITYIGYLSKKCKNMVKNDPHFENDKSQQNCLSIYNASGFGFQTSFRICLDIFFML